MFIDADVDVDVDVDVVIVIDVDGYGPLRPITADNGPLHQGGRSQRRGLCVFAAHFSKTQAALRAGG